ncbi:MAG: hypothetical protein ACOYMN_00030 [Roseimicrobium sp.]
MKKQLPVHDLDLWVRSRKEREKLCRALLRRGAVLLQDFHPYCLKFRLEGQLIEVTYHNVKNATLRDVLHTFDIAVSAIGCRFQGNSVAEAAISDECWEAVRRREVRVLESYFCFLDVTKAPSLLRTLHRMGQKAGELGYKVHESHEHRLWEAYWHDYSEDERRAAMDLYFDTMVAYKGQQDTRLVHRATVGYLPAVRSQADHAPMKLLPRHA